MKNNFIVKIIPLILVILLFTPVVSFALVERNTSSSNNNVIANTTNSNTTTNTTSNNVNSNILNQETNTQQGTEILEIPETTEGDNNVTKIKFISLEAKPKSSIVVSIGANNINSITKLELAFKRLSKPNLMCSATVANLTSLEPSFVLPNELEGGEKIELIYVTVEDAKGTHYISNISDIVPDRKYTIDVLADGTNYNLNKISLNGETTIKSDGTLNFDIDLSAGIENLGLMFRNVESNNGFYFTISNKDGLHSKPTVDFSKITTKGNRLAPGKYVLTEAYINPGPKTIQYTTFKQYGDQRELKDKVEFEITEEEQETNNFTLTSFSIGENKAQEITTTKGKIIPIWIESSEKVIGGTLTLLDSQDQQVINVPIQEKIDNNKNYSTYIIIPETAYLATYELTYATLKTETTTNYIRKGTGTNRVKGFDFNVKTSIIEKSSTDENNLMSLDNSDMLAKDIEEIKKLPSNSEIRLFTGFNPIVSIEVFKALKNTEVELIIYDNNNNQWIFNGEDIETNKTIDTSIETRTIDSDKEKYEIKSGIELIFNENEALPGKAQIRIKNTKLEEQELPNKNGYTYYYDEQAKLFDRVTMQINLTDDNYYEFYINHNSNYVMVSEQINNQFVSNKTDDYILNGGKAENINNNGNENELISNIESITKRETKENNSMLLIIIIAFATLFILIAVILVLIKKNKNRDLSSGNKLYSNPNNNENINTNINNNNNANNFNNLNNMTNINNTNADISFNNDYENQINNNQQYNNQFNNNNMNMNNNNNFNNYNMNNDFNNNYNNNLNNNYNNQYENNNNNYNNNNTDQYNNMNNNENNQ